MYYIGVDVGGTGIKAGIVDENGQVLYKEECKTNVEGGFEKVKQDIKQLIENLLVKSNLTNNDIKSIGFGLPGLVDNKGYASCVNLKWQDVPFINEIQSLFDDIEIYAGNDATVAALAESKFGTMKDNDIAVMLTLGTGLGAGIIINGKPLIGAHGMASEIGHCIVGENYYDCNCGSNGCFETFCSATAMINYAKKLIKDGMDSLIIKECNNNYDKINAKVIFDCYRENDEVAKLVVNRFKHYLGKGIGSLINTLDPGIISIGGGLSKSGDIILDGLEEEIKKNVLHKNRKFADINIATLGNDAGIIGAAFLS